MQRAAPLHRTVLYRLAVVQRARQAGFTLDEIKALFVGFAEGTCADVRWRRLADRKLIELKALAERIATMQALLERLKANPHARALREISGKTILEKGVQNVTATTAARHLPLPVIDPRSPLT